MERFAIKELEKWKNKSNRKPMVLMGARQVGKTWLMKTFGEKNYKKVAYISFYNNRNNKFQHQRQQNQAKVVKKSNQYSNLHVC